MNEKEWLLARIAPDSMRAASNKLGKSQNYLTQAVNQGLPIDLIIAICRTYNYPVIQGLRDLKVVSDTESITLSVEEALQKATHEQLLAEIERRLLQGDPEAKRRFTASENSNTIDWNRARQQRAQGREVPPVAEFDPATYTGPMAADSSPHEPGPGDENYHDGP